MPEFLTIFLTLIPAYIANITPVLLYRFKILEEYAYPIHEIYFGENKTVRGYYGAIITGSITGLIQYVLVVFFGTSVGSVFSSNKIILGAFLLSVGAISGDLIKSFLKRKFHKNSGEMWFPFDYIDFILGSFIFSGMFLFFSIWKIAVVLVFFAFFTPLFNYISKSLGIKKEL